MLGIICAMKEEIKGIEDILNIKEEIQISSMNFKIGEICGKKCVIALSGIGKVNAAMCTQTMILKFKVNYIINVGMAGGIGKNINIYDLVIAKNVIQHDYDTSAFGDKKRGEISALGICEIPCNEGLIKIAINSAKEMGMNFFVGNILTGDQFINDKDKIFHLRDEFNGLACEMECASIGQVCYMNNVEFIALKIISDSANKSSAVEFQNFVDKYPQNIAELINNLIAKL